MNTAMYPILLQAEGGGAAFDPPFALVLGAIFLIFYFLVLRPQQRQQKQRDAAIKGIVRGDKVVTAGGIHGLVIEVEEDKIRVEIARVKGGLKVEVDVARSGIGSVTKAATDEGGEAS